MDYTEKIIKQSNYWYNDGLNRANFRDLSGAIVSLEKSLQYCAHNVAARNLLGLVYYGRGEINEALVQWIISKNIRPRDNIANYFIRKMQGSSSELNRVNANVKKYNQCLLYCQQDAKDLAFIQLKKIVVAHPTFVKAYQLLALLCIENEQYARAKQALKKAHKIDTTDAITLYYLNELSERKAAGRKSKEEPNTGVHYQVGNETIIQPTSPTLKAHANALTVMNIVIGIIMGVAVMVFLIEPMLLENEALINADAIRTYSQKIDVQEAQISALQTELDSYRTISDEVDLALANIETMQTNYERLSEVENLFYEGETSELNLAELLNEIDATALGEVALARYETLIEVISEPICQEHYEQALLDYEEENYDSVISELEQVIYVMESYKDYKAMLLLAQVYEMEDNKENASYYANIVLSYADNETVLDDAMQLLETIEYNTSTAEANAMNEDTTEDTTEEE